MDTVIMNACNKFPRLNLLSSKDILTVVSNIGDPIPLTHIISKVFPAVKIVRFSKISSSKNLGSTNDGQLEQYLIIKFYILIFYTCRISNYSSP